MMKSKDKYLVLEFEDAIVNYEIASSKKIESMPDGLSGKILRTTGDPVIFDSDTHRVFKRVQRDLASIYPQYKELIFSAPEIMDGFAWKRVDFLSLYCDHYRIVVERLKRIIGIEG